MVKKTLTGVQEWMPKSVNIQYGCENDCRYCYAKKMAIRYNRVSPEGWSHPIMKTKRPILPKNSQVMFPSTHDITPNNLTLSIQGINLLLSRGNDVLVVSKPRLECIRVITNHNGIFNSKNHLEFRFTIGSIDNQILKSWELNAPEFEERFACLQMGLQRGFKCSVSCEPLLDKDCKIVDFLLQYPKIDSIWIGAMNYMKDSPQLDYQTIYAKYKDNPKIKWKESFRKHLNQMIPTEFIYYCHFHCRDNCQAIQIGNLQKREEFCEGCSELRFEEDNVDCEYRDTHADCCEPLVIK